MNTRINEQINFSNKDLILTDISICKTIGCFECKLINLCLSNVSTIVDRLRLITPKINNEGASKI